MIYCISDIHGRIDLFEKMLDKIQLKKGDMLYVLGDCIDRGGGIEVLVRIKQLHDEGLCTLIKGNHEAMLIANVVNSKLVTKETLIRDIEYDATIDEQSKRLKEDGERIKGKEKQTIFDVITVFNNLQKASELLQCRKDIMQEKVNCLKALPIFTQSDSYKTISDFNKMSNTEFEELTKFINSCPVREEIKIGLKTYVLVHASDKKDATDYDNMFEREKFYLNKTDYGKRKIVVFGHTTTRDIGIIRDNEVNIPYKIWFDDKYHDKIGIDCGASYPNGQLACLRLNDMKEFYVENERKSIVPFSYVNNKFNNLLEYRKQYGAILDEDLKEKMKELYEGIGFVKE